MIFCLIVPYFTEFQTVARIWTLLTCFGYIITNQAPVHSANLPIYCWLPWFVNKQLAQHSLLADHPPLPVSVRVHVLDSVCVHKTEKY
jgi:hypothetical protein